MIAIVSPKTAVAWVHMDLPTSSAHTAHECSVQTLGAHNQC